MEEILSRERSDDPPICRMLLNFSALHANGSYYAYPMVFNFQSFRRSLREN